MKFARLKALGVSCACFFFVVMSASVQAADYESKGPALSIEGWISAGSQDLPILSFDNAQLPSEEYADVRVENVTVDADGSIRFQLTHSGPMSRQVFAHVRRVEQDDGYTRSIITNLADGQQMEYLTPAVEDPLRGKFDKESANDMLAQAALGGDQNVECPWCYWGTIIVSEAVCAAGVALSFYNCRITCRYRGGVVAHRTGICGMYNAECLCAREPLPVFGEFGSSD